MEQELDLGVYLAIARRRYLYLLLPAIVICVAAVVTAYVIPRSFEATATILVESQRIPTDLASPTVTADAAERIKIIEQRLLARDNLLTIANKFHLYPSDADPVSPTDIVLNMRQAISIRQIDVGGRSSRSGDVIGFTVAFQYKDATTASRVANELVTSILSQNVEARLSRASETSKFFEQQSALLEQQLLALENRIAEFKRANEASLPETMASRREELAAIATRIADLERKLRLASDKDANFLDGNTANAEQLELRLQAQQMQLDSMQQERDQLSPLAEKGFVPKKRLVDLDHQIAMASIDLASINSQLAQIGVVGDRDKSIALLKSQRDELASMAEKIQNNISATPAIEAELAALDRDHENLQEEYRQTKAKLVEARTGERLEQDRQAERFEVLEQASVPDQATKPNRKKIILMGSMAGVGFGLGLVVLLEMLDQSLRTANDLERRLQMRPIGVIPYIETAAEARRRIWTRLTFAVFVLVAVATALAAIHVYYMPLDLVAERIWAKVEATLPIGG